MCGNRTLMNGIMPRIIPKLGNIDVIMKNPIPMNIPKTNLLLRFADLCLPNINGIDKNSIITVDRGMNNFSQYIFFYISGSKLFLIK